MRLQRIDNYKKLEEMRGSKLLVYVTGDRPNAETNIGADIIAPFSQHLDIIQKSDKISLFLYSNGGSTLAAWSLVNLIRSYCNELEIIVPFKCQSAATLISLGADRIIMTKQATLGPIDPSTNGFMNPQITLNGQQIRVPVSVEHVNGYLEMAKSDLNITNELYLKEIYLKLTDYIHPLSLGDVYKSKSQIKMLAEKLLKYHLIDDDYVPKVVNFLCSDSGSHDYTINRKEAREELGLNIEKPDDNLYSLIKEIYLDIEEELELRSPYNPNQLIYIQNPYNYSLRRAIIESVDGGTDVYLSEGDLIQQNIQMPGANGLQSILNDNRYFEGWRHEI